MYLDEIIKAQKRGEAKGITSICSAHPWVLKAAMQTSEVFKTSEVLLIESTCNQVNQFGGYTGMTPADFVGYVQGIAKENNFPFENIILGGDHLGPNVWQNESAESAMQKSEIMIRDYVKAGFVKIHLDCSMKLGDDSKGVLDMEIPAKRAAQLAKIAEMSVDAELVPAKLPRYIIGTEVPIPGGAHEHEEAVSVTNVHDVEQTIQVTREAFYREKLQSAWERVIGVVVQPGVEFGDDFVLEYQPVKTKNLSRFIENQAVIYEGHSTDYQTGDGLSNLVRDHFAILKVGPALTFSFREAVFALAMMEDELFSKDTCSNLIQVLDDVMLRNPEYWQKHYQGTSAEQAFKRKYSFSDRIRYYWPDPQVQSAMGKLLKNLDEKPLPLSLLSQFMPNQYEHIRRGEITQTPEAIIFDHIHAVLLGYKAACNS
ncbi:MAG: D-tagatose-bisphosphate aldolase, class II, non-catalytic subunit [Anaerolineales bacterium]|nr:D-tagatose-bisphosphate aldolase, class II, non-catalytic subunit [Anaerolineales bacterium]